MKTVRVSLILTAVCSVLIGSGPLTTTSTLALAGPPTGDNLLPATRQELARVRTVTAKYHDIIQAEADGYASISFFESGEGFHWENGVQIDANFDPEKPEELIYALVGNHLKLVAVDYFVPSSFEGGPPEGFTGDADVWRWNEEFLAWELDVWIWLDNPDGIFAHLNPRVP